MTSELLLCALFFLVGLAFGWELKSGARSEDLRRSFMEGRDGAIANAAMTAYDMGHPDVRQKINALVECDQ